MNRYRFDVLNSYFELSGSQSSRGESLSRRTWCGCQPVFAGTDSALPTKRRTQRTGVAVSNLTRNAIEGVRRLAEQVSSEGQPACGEEGHRWLADEVAEPSRQPGNHVRALACLAAAALYTWALTTGEE
jgi:hypothetical protein